MITRLRLVPEFCAVTAADATLECSAVSAAGVSFIWTNRFVSGEDDTAFAGMDGGVTWFVIPFKGILFKISFAKSAVSLQLGLGLVRVS